jgi:hypothetical protein
MAAAFVMAVDTAGAGPATASKPASLPTTTSSAPADELGTAHNPCFSDKTLWPELTGKEYFLKQSMPPGRVMTWARPGISGGLRGDHRLAGKGVPMMDPANWLLNGKPCQKVEFDENTDIVLPDSSKLYELNGREDPGWPETFRSITVGRNAVLGGGGDGKGRKIFGNVWIKAGGGMDSQGAAMFLGSQHVFFRNDNTPKTIRGTDRGQGIMSSQYFTFNKTDGASVEFLGHVSVLDEFRIYGCTVIVGPGSKLEPGRNAVPEINQGGSLALMDGARFQSWNNDFETPEMVVSKGNIQGGLPDRPLTRSCHWGLAFKNHSGAKYTGANAEKYKADYPRVPSLVMHAGSMRSYSTDLAKAHLVITTMENERICPDPDSAEYKKSIAREGALEEYYKWKLALPRGIDAYFGKDVMIDGVEFEQLRAGGLMYRDAAARAGWKNITFGQGCAAKGEAAFTQLDKELSRGLTY